MITRTAAQILGDAGLPPPPSSPSSWSSFKNGCGRYYQACPRCSSGRSTKAHRDAKVLGVRIDDVGVKFGCNHCGWTGGGYFKSNSVGRNDGFSAVYDYHDRDGKLLFQKVRNHPGREPRFWLRRPDGNGGWINNTEGVDTSVLYRLPEVVEAISLDREIALVEGEKDADNLWKIGIPATCNAHGAADPTKNQKPKWTLAHSDQLRGARLVVFNDNDRAGYDHAEATCKLSLGIAKSVRRLDLKLHWSDMPEKADVSDWLVQPSNTREKLDTLMAMAPDYEEDGGEQGPQAPPLPFRRHGEKEPLDDRAWLVDNLVPEVGTGVLAGQWGTLKTFVALELAQCVMTTRPFLNFDIVRPGGVLMLALEGQSEVAIRIQGALENKGTEYHKGAPFYWCEACPPLTNPKTAEVIITTAKAVAAEFNQRFDLPLSLILIDSLVAGAGYSKEGQDNDAAIAHRIMMVAAEVGRALGCFVFVIDHYGKDTNVGTRGSSVKEGDADVIFACLGDRSEGGEVSNSRVALRKRRSGPNGEEFAFQGKVVEMGLNPKTGKMETTLVIEWSDGGDQTKPKKDDWGRGKAVRTLRRIIMNLLADCGEQIRPYADGPTVRALKLKLVEDEFYKSYATPADTEEAKKHAKRMAFKRALEQAGDKITTREIGDSDYIWLPQKGPGETAEATAGAGASRQPQGNGSGDSEDLSPDL